MVQQIRIRRAAEQLWQSGQKLQQVAVLTGYGDSFSFSRAFKRVMGVSPSQYRAGWKKVDRQSELVPVPSSSRQREMSPVSARKKRP
ncbi:helix-turn-helix domain-containing protein [bacterium]|nr:helix-turn-helix domain-containing protein [bacterium]